MDMYALFVYVPQTHEQALREALAQAGAGAIGNYDSASFVGTGRFRPLEGARPAIGSLGVIEAVPEARIESIVPGDRLTTVIAAARAAHPYEEPGLFAFKLHEACLMSRAPMHVEPALSSSAAATAGSAAPVQGQATTRPISVVLEGLDGVGKSTVSRLLAQRLSAVLLQTPIPAMHAMRPYFDALHSTVQPAHDPAAPPEGSPDRASWLAGVRHGYYMAGNFLAGAQMCETLSAGCSVVMDRYYASTKAYILGKTRAHSIQDLPQAGSTAYAWPAELPKPDFMIVLTLNERERLSRREARTAVAETEEEAMFRLQEAIGQRINEAYRRFGCTEVDASGPPEKVLERVLQVLGR